MAIKAQLIESIKRERENLEKLIAALSDPQMEVMGVSGAWSVKEVLGHLSFWEGNLVEAIKTWKTGGTPGWPDNVELDILNAKQYIRDHTRPLGEIRSEAARTYRGALDQIESLTEAELEKELRGKPFADEVAKETLRHYQTHAAEIQTWLSRRS